MTGTVAGPSVQIGRGLAGEKVLWAFTDPEALGAWGRLEVKGAEQTEGTALSWEAVVELAGPGGSVVRNAAGPAGAVISVGETGSAVDAGWGEAGAALVDDVAARASVRSEAAEAFSAASLRAGAGDWLGAIEAATAAAYRCRDLGDLLHAGVVGADLAVWLTAADRIDDAAEAAEQAGLVLGALGETEMATTSLLRSAEWSLATGDQVRAQRIAEVVTAAVAGSSARRLAALWQQLPAVAGAMS